MKNKNYDNALTLMEEKELEKLMLEFLECLEELESIGDRTFLNENEKILTEVSLWDKAKYYLGKIGRYKAGGKIFGKKKTDKEAKEKIEKILNKKGNEFIKNLHQTIQKMNKGKDGKGKGEFPNNMDPEIFLEIILTISATYDSIVEATKKDVKDKGFLPIDAANKIITDLREYVKKYLDVDVQWTRSIFDHEEESDNDLLNEKWTDKVWNFVTGGGKDDKHKDVRKKLQGKVGKDAEKFDSERMKTLYSNKLPLILAAIGGSLAALGWLAQTDWLKSLLESWLNTDGVPGQDAVTQSFDGGKPDAEGMVHWMREIDPSNPVENGSDITDFINKHGAENVSHMFDGNGAGDSMEQMGKLQDLVSGDGANQSVGELFRGDTYGDMKGGRNLFGISKAASFASKVIVKQAVKATAGSAAGTVLATKLAFLGSILLPIGITVLGTGTLVKAMRVKGRNQSRSKTLNDLLQSLQNIKPTKQNPPVIDEPKGDGGEREPKGGGVIGTTDPVPPITTDIPADFLKGNRNMQLAYLAQNFLPGGKSLWDSLGLKEGTVLPSGFFDAALGQGKVDQEKYLRAFHKHLEKNDSFTKKINSGAWMAKIQSNKNQGLISWVRNTRKGIGSFIKKIKKAFPEFGIGERQKAKVSRPGERGKAMGLAGESLNGRYDLITELNMGNAANAAGFEEDLFMKNLPQFMEMLSMMYYGAKGSKLPYNKGAVLKTCKKYGCKGGSSKKYKQTKSDDYQFVEGEEILSEEIKRIRQLMK